MQDFNKIYAFIIAENDGGRSGYRPIRSSAGEWRRRRGGEAGVGEPSGAAPQAQGGPSPPPHSGATALHPAAGGGHRRAGHSAPHRAAQPGDHA